MTSSLTGWGSFSYGSSPYGSSLSSSISLVLLTAIATSDNVLQLTFNYAPIFNNLLDAFDASNINDYVITPIISTVGADNLVPKQVNPINIIQGITEEILLVTMDRTFSPFPAQYRITISNLMSVNGYPLNSALNTQLFYGVSRGLSIQRSDMITSSKDIANKQFSNSLVGTVSIVPEAYQLGTIPTNVQGDIATDDGLESYTKRVMRRCMTRKGGFAGLPDYGVGLPYQIKQLATSSIRSSLASEAEAQILQEPETKQVKCTFKQDTNNPSLFWLNIQVTTIFGNNNLPIAVPIYIS